MRQKNTSFMKGSIAIMNKKLVFLHIAPKSLKIAPAVAVECMVTQTSIRAANTLTALLRALKRLFCDGCSSKNRNIVIIGCFCDCRSSCWCLLDRQTIGW